VTVNGVAAPRGSLHLTPPAAGSDQDLAAFAELVRLGFPAAEHLDVRIAEARLLALHRTADGRVVAIGALKRPDEQHRRELFAGAGVSVHAAEYELELGWIFVDPAFRRSGIASRLCTQLLMRVPHARVFATTRPSNDAMMSILRAHGFTQLGLPFPHPRRKEHLALFVRHRHGSG
jgi:ribosomal protein S18 acetylase RimI-like enzyme